MLVDSLCQGPAENRGFPAFLDDLRQPRVAQVLTRYSLGSIWYQRRYGERWPTEALRRVAGSRFGFRVSKAAHITRGRP
jgi:hypothetical protein